MKPMNQLISFKIEKYSALEGIEMNTYMILLKKEKKKETIDSWLVLLR